MNWVSFRFIDNVCHQLQFWSLEQARLLSDSWSKFGSEHCRKRREFAFNCRVDDKDGEYFLEKLFFFEEVKICDLNLEFHRITSINCDSVDPREIPVSLDELQLDIFPTVTSLVTNCRWPYLNPEHSAQSLLFFKAFQNCPGFNDIHVREEGEESRDFASRQVDLGNVHTLDLQTYLTNSWAAPENLAQTLRTFVNSARFRGLCVNHRVPNDFELVELFLERALAGELKEGARIRIESITFAKSQLGALHPEHREDSEELAWRIPNSNRRIVDAWRASEHSFYIALLNVDTEKKRAKNASYNNL